MADPQHEPTMEEILASIRKIISEDSEPAQPAAAPPPPAEAPAAEAHEHVQEEPEVLELTQELPSEPVRIPDPVYATTPVEPSRPEADIVFEPQEEPASMPAASSNDDDIFSDKTRKALDETFASIPDAVEPAAPQPAVAVAPVVSAPEGHSIEAVFERAVVGAFDPVLHRWMDKNRSELLVAVRPLIREWMDAHFPALLEGAVRNEVARVVRARGGK